MKIGKYCYCQSSQCIYREEKFCKYDKAEINGTSSCKNCKYEDEEGVKENDR